MARSQNFFIGMLLMLAITLTVVLVVVEPSPRKADALMISQSGDIVLLTTGVVGGDDLLNVIDTRNGKMITYGYLINKRALQAVAVGRIPAK